MHTNPPSLKTSKKDYINTKVSFYKRNSNCYIIMNQYLVKIYNSAGLAFGFSCIIKL